MLEIILKFKSCHGGYPDETLQIIAISEPDILSAYYIESEVLDL